MKVHVKGVPYIDDLRGIKNSEGRKIKPHLLYRSANLSKMKDNGEYLQSKYNVKDVIDLRTDDEIKNKPESLNKDINYYHFPIATAKENPTVSKETRMKMLKEISARPGGTKKYMRDFYPVMMRSEKAIGYYKQIFKLLLEGKKDEAVLFHCTQGKDRTGIILMLILSALEVKKKIIIKQYMRYNCINWFFKFYVGLGMTLFKSPRLAVALSHFLSARKAYIEAAYETIDKEFKGIKNYLSNIIGLTDNDIKTLKLKYLK